MEISIIGFDEAIVLLCVDFRRLDQFFHFSFGIGFRFRQTNLTEIVHNVSVTAYFACRSAANQLHFFHVTVPDDSLGVIGKFGILCFGWEALLSGGSGFFWRAK